ncbi:hypothetical protein CcaverHIS002_0509780 [Cutaneotrichosporon cavernicola]|uniref:nicotinamidase n=1 Tax=Cutaneotrichosporon cavernicola TaxID=279322 RepID=A0AA48QXJ1_9TREE|nr:uncharacterized protein CcaverHIS019_0510330 [Cutaneotrichosporon cavernicola]BEI85577.1 hypothetical protein CcaverHIS002_0509780 [Cutaneotrichosporon cavernicola]BEI93405.1 hypothetical protein CcaverHIS019_0510330 [Cutaneotrichosporon cavernicola]
MGKTALIIVDVQGDFLPPDGSLMVPAGLLVAPTILDLLKDQKYNWDYVVVSQDYHPTGHISFASSHPGHKVFSDIELKDGRGILYEQKLWPDHCVQGTKGCEIAPELVAKLSKRGDTVKLVRKGWHKDVEAYSAFDGYMTDFNNPADPPTEIDYQPQRKIVQWLREQGVTKVVVTGLAAELCVSHTALSAVASRFQTAVLQPATRALEDRDAEEQWDKLCAVGARVIGRSNRPRTLRWEDELKQWLAAEDAGAWPDWKKKNGSA